MSQKVCICGREKSKEKPLLITINACKNQHPFSKKSSSKTNQDREPPDEDDEPETPPNEKMQESTHVLQSTVDQGKLSPISEKSLQSLSRSTQTFGQPSTHRTLETHANSKPSPQTSSKSIIKEPSITEESKSSAKPLKSSSDKSGSLKTDNEALESMKKTSNNSKTSSNTSSKSILKVPSSIQKSNNVSQTSSVDQGNQSGSPALGKSAQSLTKTTRTSFDKSNSSGKFSPKKLSFSENEELLLASTQNAQSDTQSLEGVEEEAKEEPIRDHILFCEEENVIRIRSRGISEETICGLDGFVEKTISPKMPYKFLEHPRVQTDKKIGPVEPRTTKQKLVNTDVEEFVKDKIFNFPSDGTMTLPRLTPRYHGPGCAMEVNVLEKHGKKCSYKKLKNPDRNPADDKVGSYDVIGRMMFKTCGGGGPNLNDATGMDKPSNQKLSELYSLLHLPVANKKQFILNASTSANQVEPVKISPSANIVSSKSFPNNYHGNVNTDGNWRDRNEIDLEELYLSDGKADKSIQMKDEQQKKWYHSLLSCFIEKSES